MRTVFALFAFPVATSAAFADPPDLWLTPPAMSDFDVTWEGFDASRVTFLPKGEDAAALKLLARHKIVALNRATFSKVLPGTPYPKDTDRKPIWRAVWRWNSHSAALACLVMETISA